MPREGADETSAKRSVDGTEPDDGRCAHRTGGGGGDGPRIEDRRRVRVENPDGVAGRYRTTHGDVRFDEPTDAGGTGSAPSPVQHLLGALGACLSLTVRAMAARDDVAVGAIECAVSGAPDEGSLSSIGVDLAIETDADADAIDVVVTKAERGCYVSRALSVPVDVEWERRD